ncbi:MAG: hypothetical protein EBX61_11915 [Betaproteobacteria bacterium]|nr:hypothetical protein [Betaproteobacteria bacterium]
MCYGNASCCAQDWRKGAVFKKQEPAGVAAVLSECSEGLQEGDTVIATTLGSSSSGSAAMKNGVPVLLTPP